MRATRLLVLAVPLVVVAGSVAGARREFFNQLLTQFHLEEHQATKDTGCQYCHVNKFGSAPWNKFGDAVRAHYQGDAKNDISQALYLRLKDNKDADGDGYADVLEVVAKTFPGDAKSKPTKTAAQLRADLTKLGGVDYFKAKPAP